mmetsp:Transcript_23724/g.30413  ORF Transcript_23724/g.30413 Transcript_23724/m.30413 type:complete len:241 (-) Transcript_23724:125-847(-)
MFIINLHDTAILMLMAMVGASTADTQLLSTDQLDTRFPSTNPAPPGKNIDGTSVTTNFVRAYNEVQHVHKDMQQNDNEEATLPQEGTVAEIPEDNFNSAHEDAAVFSDNGGDERSVVVPGFMFIAGPDYTGTGIHTGYVSGSEDGNINEGAVIIQGFLPEDDPLRRRRSRAESTREQRIRERVQRLIDNAITLDDSAVRPIPFEGDGDEENNGLDGAQSNSSGRDDYGVARYIQHIVRFV